MSRTIVTGAARGIGGAIAEALAAEGRELLLVDLADGVGEVAGRLGEGVDSLVADIADPAGRQAVRERAGAVAGVVHAAGITRDALLAKMTAEQFGTVLEVNLAAAYELTLALLDRCEEGASVVSISSRSYLGNVGQFNYAASKGGLVGMTRALALEHAPRLRFNAVAPGFIDTEMTAAIPAEVRARILGKIPAGRAGEPAEVASAVRWLLSAEASYVTGQVLFVCGGRSYA